MFNQESDEKISNILGKFVQQGNIKKGYELAAIQKAWDDSMSVLIKKYTKSLSFKNGTLYLYLLSAALKQELFAEKLKLIKLLNAKIGSDLVTDVVIR